MIAWGFIGNYSCATAANCSREDNMGWRYTFFTMGAITFIMVCHLESRYVNPSSSDDSSSFTSTSRRNISSARARMKKRLKLSKQLQNIMARPANSERNISVLVRPNFQQFLAKKLTKIHHISPIFDDH